MLYIIAGEDYDFFSKEKEAIKKRSGITDEYIVTDREHCDTVYTEFSVDGFFPKPDYIIIYKYLFDEMHELDTVHHLALLGQTKHTIIIAEKTISKELKAFAEKQNIVIIEPRKKVEKKEITPFAFTDEVIARNKKDAWIAYMHLRTNHVEVSQILAGTIWAMKSLVLSMTYKTVQQTGINPYVFTKLQKQQSKWTIDEATRVYLSLLVIAATEQFDEEAQSIKIEQLLFTL